MTIVVDGAIGPMVARTLKPDAISFSSLRQDNEGMWGAARNGGTKKSVSPPRSRPVAWDWEKDWSWEWR